MVAAQHSERKASRSLGRGANTWSPSIEAAKAGGSLVPGYSDQIMRSYSGREWAEREEKRRVKEGGKGSGKKKGKERGRQQTH